MDFTSAKMLEMMSHDFIPNSISESVYIQYVGVFVWMCE